MCNSQCSMQKPLRSQPFEPLEHFEPFEPFEPLIVLPGFSSPDAAG